MCHWIVLLVFCWGFLHLHLSGKVACSVLFFWCLWYQDNAGLIKWVWSVPSSSIFWKHLRKIGINSLNVCWNSPVMLSVPDFVCVGGRGLSLPIQSHYWSIGFSVSPWFSSGRLCVSRNLFISSRLSNFLPQLFIIFLCNPVCYCRIGYNIPSFIYDFSNFTLFLLVNLGKYLKKNSLCIKKFAHNSVVYKGKKPWLLLTFSSQKLLISVETLLCARPSTCIMSFNSHNSHVR